MIFIGIGANLDHPDHGNPRQTCEAALETFGSENIHISKRSSWYRSPPMPPSDQPDYVNAVVRIETDLRPEPLLVALLTIERRFGRSRGAKNAARTLDLDVLDYQGQILESESGLIVPHPRLHDRAFVLLPLAEIAPDWRHPQSGAAITELIARLGDYHGTIPAS